ncbi:MAG: hypothetical protein DRQ60_06565, partial [Gammaproteobacteria bacterium]
DLTQLEVPCRFTVIEGDREHAVSSLAGLLALIRQLGQRGIALQRYKGLGEMNPQQLWETTMDPKQRTLLQVTLDDAEEANRIFETLMGDEVEERREFIQQNALEVQNLDI